MTANSSAAKDSYKVQMASGLCEERKTLVDKKTRKKKMGNVLGISTFLS